MRNVPVLLLSAVDTSTQTGSQFFAGQWIAGSFIPLFGDLTAAGTVTIQGSNDIPVGDPTKYVPATGSWKDIPTATSTIASGVGPAFALANMNFQYIRAVYTRSGGGSTTVTINATVLSV